MINDIRGQRVTTSLHPNPGIIPGIIILSPNNIFQIEEPRGRGSIWNLVEGLNVIINRQIQLGARRYSIRECYKARYGVARLEREFRYAIIIHIKLVNYFSYDERQCGLVFHLNNKIRIEKIRRRQPQFNL
jgi:hypothetical protein